MAIVSDDRIVISWKDKILDYEIETSPSSNSSASNSWLEKIRFSITRLKHRTGKGKSGTQLTWKDKILDYEIETMTRAR